jgi:hypothetical protein
MHHGKIGPVIQIYRALMSTVVTEQTLFLVNTILKLPLNFEVTESQFEMAF